jgi:tetratricopeptide (TPR) repeat protein
MLRMIVWTATVWVIIVCFAGCAQKNTSSNSTITSDRESKWIKSNPDAIANAKDAKMPDINEKTYFTAGLLSEKSGNLVGAIGKYSKAVETNPKYLPPYNQLGQLYMQFQEYNQAENVYQLALKQHPKNPMLLNNLAFVHMMQRDYVKAEAEFNQVLAIDPNSKGTHVNLGVALAKQNKYADALDHFRVGCPEYQANYNLAIILHGKGELELASKYYRTSLRFNPNFEPSKKGLKQITKPSKPIASNQPASVCVTNN